jgi:hypothetical protein
MHAEETTDARVVAQFDENKGPSTAAPNAIVF